MYAKTNYDLLQFVIGCVTNYCNTVKTYSF